MPKITLQGLRTIHTDENDFDPNKDYGIFLVASLKGKYIPETFEEDKQTDIKFFFQISHLDSIVDLKDRTEVKIKEGRSKSQIWRFIVENELGEYEALMDWLIANQTTIFDMYRENLTN